MKKFAIPVITAFILVAVLAVPALALPEAAPVPLPAGTASPRDWDKNAPDGNLKDSAVKADSAILIDEKTGTVLFEKDADKKRFPASITKIMTCLLALESIEKDGRKLSDHVTIGDLPKLPPDYADIDLKKGETLTLENLLYALMLPSANDAANAIAKHISPDGTIEGFVAMMNDKAAELGMTGTHYMNTNGLHDENHFTTARDMATLARAARKLPEFQKIVGTPTYTMPATNIHKDKRVWENHNLLISKNKNEPYGYIYATGVKTGYTEPAMQTFVGSAKKDNVSLIAVVLHDKGKTDKWVDSVTMFEYGFKFFNTLDLKALLGGQTITLAVKNAVGNDPGKGTLNLQLLPKTPNPYITDRADVIEQLKNDTSQFEVKQTITKDTAPIAKDEVVGTVTFSYKGEVKLECDLLASRDVKEMPTPAPTVSAMASANGTQAPGSTGNAPAATGSTAANGSKSGGAGVLFIWLGSFLLLLLLAMLAIRFINMRNRNRKYRQYNYRQNSNSTKNR